MILTYPRVVKMCRSRLSVPVRKTDENAIPGSGVLIQARTRGAGALMRVEMKRNRPQAAAGLGNSWPDRPAALPYRDSLSPRQSARGGTNGAHF